MTLDYAATALPGVRRISPYEPGKPLEELERELGIRDAVKLASNENPLGPGERARRAMREALADVALYPDGSAWRLRHALAERLGVAAQRITVGNGSNDVLELVGRAYLRPGDEVVYSEHAFVVYGLVTLATGATPVVTPARDYGHDLEAMADAVGERTRMVFIANPNNPTGTWVDRGALEAFLGRVPPRVLVVVDEAYFEYVGEPAYPDAMAWVDRFPNLVVTRTFSKIHGLAGVRVGYAVSDPGVADVMNRVRQPFNVNSIGLAAAEAALDDVEHVERSRALNDAGLAQLTEGARRLGLDFIPSVGNFLTIDVATDARPVFEALLHRGVIVRPLHGYGLPRHLRVSVGRPEENERALAALAQVLGR